MLTILDMIFHGRLDEVIHGLLKIKHTLVDAESTVKILDSCDHSPRQNFKNFGKMDFWEIRVFGFSCFGTNVHMESVQIGARECDAMLWVKNRTRIN